MRLRREPEHLPPQRDNGHLTQTPGARLFLLTPALHLHPASDTWLRYFAPEIEWEFARDRRRLARGE